MTIDSRHAGRVALITGAASGIGRATVLRLLEEGASVFAVDIDEAGLARLPDDVAERVDEAAVKRLVTQRCDVTKSTECRGAVEASVETFGALDILGNVAGIGRAEHFTEVTEASYRQMMAINVDGYFFLAQAAVPHLLHDGGVIVNIASNAGIMGQAYSVVYCMSKGAVVQLTRSLAMEYFKTPLRVVAIAPGFVQTALSENYSMPSDVEWDLVGRYMTPRPAAEPDEIAGLFAYLASADARNIHGAIISTDNGMTAG